jgi:hypothetical protein
MFGGKVVVKEWSSTCISKATQVIIFHFAKLKTILCTHTNILPHVPVLSASCNEIFIRDFEFF